MYGAMACVGVCGYRAMACVGVGVRCAGVGCTYG